MTDTPLNKQIDYLKIKNIIVSKLTNLKKKDILDNINPQNILYLITFTMSVIDKYSKKAPGVDKKQMCLNIIYDFIEQSPINKEKKEYIIMILTDIYDTYVENIIKVSRGEFDINKITTMTVRIVKFFKRLACIRSKSL